MATESVATKSPQLPDHVLSNAAQKMARHNVDRAITVLELIESAARNLDDNNFGGGAAIWAREASGWLLQVMQVLDEAPAAQGA